MQTRYLSISLRPALAYLALSIVIPVFVYTAVQQTLRQSANDPQIQLAEDAAAAISLGHAPDTVVTGAPVDMRFSLSPFIIVTDTSRKVLASTGRLDGATPLPPAGSFTAARSGHMLNSPVGENRFTWEPAPGVRQAAVIVAYKDGYVLSARNLREVEFRDQHILGLAAAVCALLVVLGLVISVNMFKRKS